MFHACNYRKITVTFSKTKGWNINVYAAGSMLTLLNAAAYFDMFLLSTGSFFP